MATWKKVITEDSAAALASLTLTAALPVAQGGTGTTSINGIKSALSLGTAAYKAEAFFATGAEGDLAATAQQPPSEGDFVDGDKTKLDALSTQATTTAALALLAPKANPIFTGTIQLPNYTDVETTLDGIATNASAISGNDTDISANTTLAGTKLAKASNLSDLANAGTARTNIGLGNVTDASQATIQAATLTAATAGDVGLGNVDNTADADKPISDASVTEFATKADLAGPSLTGTTNAVNVTTSGNVIVGGTLTVSGTVTTVNTETINLADNFINLNSNATTAAPSEDAGITVNRGGTEANAQLFWDEGIDRWSLSLENLASEADAATSNAYLTAVYTSTSAPTGNPSYGGTSGHGNMHVKTNTGDIYIYA
jgi:hypothetical protein